MSSDFDETLRSLPFPSPGMPAPVVRREFLTSAAQLLHFLQSLQEDGFDLDDIGVYGDYAEIVKDTANDGSEHLNFRLV